MTFKPKTWYPIAVVVTVLNMVAAGFAAASTEPVHASTHAALAVAFGLWAQRLRSRRGERTVGSEVGGRGELGGGSELQTGLEALEAEVSKLRQELSDTQERLDFFERVLAKGQDARRVGPQP